MIGTTVGSYQITEKLAEGGMGAVFVAKHAVMGRDAVVKLLLPELSHNEEMVRRFFNEARAAAAINDPGIVQIFDVGYLPDRRAYIVMERLRGETLALRLRTRRLGPDESVRILRLLSRTLDAAHAHGIVHRDLKPDNIFLVGDRDVTGGERTKILDFGIAKLADAGGTHATRSGSIFGTPAYMAPEQCSDAATVDARADLYAIGCIAYELLCGQPPFGTGGIELLAAHLRDEPEPLRQRAPQVPPWLDHLVHRLLRKSPGERFQSAAELLAALDANRPSGEMTPQPFAAIAPPAGPASSPGPVAPALTTHAAAAGMVVKNTPPPGSRRPYIVGGVAVVAIGAIAMVMLGKGSRDAAPAGGEPPAPAPQVAAQPPAPPPARELPPPAPVETGSAAVVPPPIKPASPSHTKPPHADGKHGAQAKPPTEVAHPAPEPPAAPTMSFDDAMMQASNELKAKQYGAALQHAQAALASRPRDDEALMTATIAACGVHNEARARAYLPAKEKGSFHEISVSRCATFGITLE